MNNIKVTLDSYKTIYKNFSIDIQDEVRNALLDQIDISEYVKSCSNDPFRLQQIRLALKEFPDINKEFFKLNGSNLYSLRGYLRNGVLTKQAERLININTDQEAYKVMLDLDACGYDLSGYDFTKIPTKLLGEFEKGIRLNLDLTFLANGKNYTKHFVIACIKLMLNKVDMRKIYNWDEETIIELSKYSQYPKLNLLISRLTALSIPKYVHCFVELINAGVTDPRVFERDEYGYEKFMPVQLSFIAETALEGFKIEEMLNPDLSLEEMYLIKGIEREKTGRRLKGVLGRK